MKKENKTKGKGAKKLKEYKKVMDGVNELRCKMLGDQIDIEKKTFEKYVRILAEYALPEACIGCLMFDDMWHDCFRHCSDKIEDTELSKKKKDELYGIILGMEKGPHTEIEILESNLKYWKSVVNSIEWEMKELPSKIKEKIVADTIKNKIRWSRQYDYNSKVYKKIEELDSRKKQK